MAEVRYRKMEGGEPDEVVAFGGLTFRVGKFVEVPEQWLQKAKGNPSFEVKGEKSFGDGGLSDKDVPVEADERRARAAVTHAGMKATQEAKQAEARGASHREDRA